jgi:hypothetical protein
MLTPEPHLLVRVEDEAGGVVFRGESATWLVDRLDLDYRVPAHELRSAPWDAVTSASVPQRLAFVMRDTGIEALSAFLDEFGPDTSLWLEVEPAEWGRIAPSDDPLT